MLLQTQSASTPALIDWRRFLEEVYQDRQTYHFRHGQIIPMASQDIWVICRGIVQVNTLFVNGDEAILGFIYPSMPFGLPLTQLHPYEAKALSDLVLMRLNQVEIESSPLLAQGIVLQLGRRLQQTEAILAMISQRRIVDRLEKMLLMLKEEIGQVTAEGIRLDVRLTHQQLANLLGTTRVTITRLLGNLRREGWLTIDQNHHFVLCDRPFPAL
ncbi:MAG: Crp/Fnr family transcriptional regulator [Acaryochloridaceae cyanobacterium SU_2_1]|nr:Crp/Fnr family transcriptional regulator [Acaryochloridaceae cyanobacterium SU_2_1]